MAITFAESIKHTMMVRMFGLVKIPMIAWVRPKIVDFSEHRIEVAIPLLRRNKNHLNSMYFGVLSVGADLACGLLAMKLIKNSSKPVQLIFASMEAEFLKRVEGPAHFVCEDGPKITELVEKAIATGERQSLNTQINVYVPTKLGQEPAARFKLLLSLKLKKPKKT